MRPDDILGEGFHLTRDPEAHFWRVTPTPSLETLRDLYRHEFYAVDKPRYLEKTDSELAYWHAIWSIRLDLMAGLTGSPGRFLDIGASGGFLLAHARDRGWQVEGIEPSRQSCAFAAERFQLSLFEGYLEDFDPETARFDAIHLSLVLEHVRDPRAFLAKALSMLRPGGAIWVEVPNDFNQLQQIITTQLDKPRWWVVPKHHLNYFDFDSLSRLLTQLGAEECDRLASFPMELFVLMGLDYIGNDNVGGQAHGYRMQLERHLLAGNRELLVNLYRRLAEMGLGRTCNLLARKTLEQ
ncbi:Class I SAM-dependent methyltransferase [Sulfidibacter corallicola]|uniref:Class I SAM-dependent methyltransferase n=1 Tax=Sulfidibacter corallicola TaxID=2818388 RepID=A0A8A4TXR8_SULCO|nr:class I SAM-dependent methyltransferase [Sulfidibacter corallicola]QTD54127.1 class I SAM-dependent methyltransferase [Sulfidibacter corallicola]